MLTKLIPSINHLRHLLLVLSATLLLGGCSHYHFPWVYRIDVQQGNIVDEDKLAQVQTGMTKRQVRYLLGTPLIVDTFNQSQWDYFYSYRTGKGVFERKRVTLKFTGDSLASVEKQEYETLELNY